MSATIKIPAQFTAVDKFSHVVKGMGRNVGKMASNGIGHIKRFDHKLNRTFKQMGRLSQLAIGVGLGTLFFNAGNDVVEYGDALAQFRTIVSDLNDKEFAKYEKSIFKVAKDTKKSAIDVVASYEKIAGLNAKFAETEKGISQVSKATIKLSKASKDDLGTSAENLVGIMNQFSFGAEQADRTINVLAAGQAVGAASITQTAEAFKNYGSVAAGANITLEESVGLIQTLGKFSIFGSEAGTKLRGVTLKLQKAGMGYASGQFNINDALDESQKKISKLATVREKDAFLLKMFGAENISVGRILLNNIEVYKEFTNGVTGTSEAQKAAEINSNTLKNQLGELKNAFTNNVIEATNTGYAIDFVKGSLGFLGDNIETFTKIGIGLLAMFVAMKGAMFVYAVYQGIATAAAWLAVPANAALAATVWSVTWPILAVIAAIALIVLAFKNWDKITAWFSKQWVKFTSWIGDAWNNLVEWFQEFDFMGFFRDIGQSILRFILAPMRIMLEMASKIPGELGDMAKGALGRLANLTGDVEVRDSLKPVDGPQVTTANKIEELRESTMKGSLNINLNDPGKMVQSTSSRDTPIPVKVTSTQGAF